MDDIRAKSINEQKFALQFTPRIKNSGWSKSNRARALKMIQQREKNEQGLGWPYCHMIFNEGNLQFELGHLTKNDFDNIIKYGTVNLSYSVYRATLTVGSFLQ
jgi:hypothetical protein